MKCDFSHLSDGLTVLVEEESEIRKTWMDYFEKCGMKLLTFDSARSFISDFRPNGDPVEFFFDQDFGSTRGVGLRLAAYVKAWPNRTGTSLVTSYPPEIFESELDTGLIDAVFPKFPEEIFGEEYSWNHFHRLVDEEGYEALLTESMSKLTKSLERLEHAFAQYPFLAGTRRK